MKKITLTSVLALCMACPAMADIAKNAQSATCDSSTIGTTTGPANLQAAWTANTIHLDWYSNDTKQTSTQCTYDGAITLPSTPTVPTGYTFGGWRVRVATAQCSGIECIDSNSGYLGRASKTTGGCSSEGNYGDVYRGVCSNETFSDLNTGEWKAAFDEGIVKGVGFCSTTDVGYGNSYYVATEIDENNAGGRCWCKVTGFNGETVSLSSPNWFGVSSSSNNSSGIAHCNESCAENCARNFVDKQFNYSGNYMRAKWLKQETSFVADCSVITDRSTCTRSFLDMYHACVWDNSSCVSPYVNDCTTITNKSICQMSGIDQYNICRWDDDGESCYEYYDD